MNIAELKALIADMSDNGTVCVVEGDLPEGDPRYAQSQVRAEVVAGRTTLVLHVPESDRKDCVCQYM